jgi:hypothetical protein
VVSSLKALPGDGSGDIGSDSGSVDYWAQQEVQYCTTKGKKTVHDVKVREFSRWTIICSRYNMVCCLLFVCCSTLDGPISRLDVCETAEIIGFGTSIVLFLYWYYCLVLVLSAKNDNIILQL